jgi:hypothetical protein
MSHWLSVYSLLVKVQRRTSGSTGLQEIDQLGERLASPADQPNQELLDVSRMLSI